MLAYVVRRTVFSVFILLLASAIIFYIVSLAGDPLTYLRQNPRVSPEDLERFTALYGLDKPLWQQYFTFLGRALQGDLGRSFVFNEPALKLIFERMPATLELAVGALKHVNPNLPQDAEVHPSIRWV